MLKSYFGIKCIFLVGFFIRIYENNYFVSEKFQKYKNYLNYFIFDKSLEIKCIQDRTFNISFKRLLAKGEPQREFEDTRNRKGLADNIVYKEKTKYISENISRLSHKNDKGLNKFDVYMKNYNRRYSQKKGLSKLDCYYEKKVFDKFQNICEFAKKANYDKKRCKKLFFKKYGIGLILFSLLPVLGFIFPILFWGKKAGDALINFCKNADHGDPEKSHDATCPHYKLLIPEGALGAINYLNIIFFSIIALIVTTIIFYVLFKAMKYEKLKAEKSKMWKQ
ncbi:hypothetical protein PVBG_06055 [Plasmodium vivax Brazil I]|uniref:Variable surface protein Vir35 n=1 Tax=Plasmodium vivax (strain Brazil I) TaxID=1033975 RepID=A0A0J9SKV5_PLAV1|nr:hypothetical protein PVBG_06055 [Plasmodium vivax Brazil I]